MSPGQKPKNANGAGGARNGRALRRPRPTTAAVPVFGYAVSILFHALLVAAFLFAFRRTFDAAPETHAVPVDLVTVSERTNVRAEAPPPPKPEKIVVPQAQPEPPPVPQMQEVEPAPDLEAPKFKIVPDKKQTPKEVQQDFTALLNKLTAAQKTPPPPKNAKAADRIINGIGAMNGMTADLADALKSQIYRCWSPPVGAPNANDLVVEFDMQLNPDGTVSGADSTAMRSGNPYTRAAAEAARRAVFQCAPYRLPAARYADWREVNPLRFDPREAMGYR